MVIESGCSPAELSTEPLDMDTNDCDIVLRFGTAFSVNPVSVLACSSLVEAVILMLSHNIDQNNNQTLSDSHGRIFEVIEQLQEYPQKMFKNLIKHFTELYNINLYIIGFNQGKFDLINRDNYLKGNNTADVAFLSFNEDNTICGPLCVIIKDNTTQTVFSSSDFSIWDNVDDYLEQLNQSKLETIVNSIQIKQQQNMADVQISVENSSIDNVSTLNTADSVQADDKIASEALIKQMIEPFVHLLNRLSLNSETISAAMRSSAFNIANLEHLSRQDIRSTLRNQISCVLDLVRQAEQPTSILQNDETIVRQSAISEDTDHQHMEALAVMDYASQASPQLIDTSVISLTAHLSNSTSISVEPTTLGMYLDAPRIITPPKEEWHPRRIQELKDMKNSLLSGQGPQRTPIQVEVPTQGPTPMFLAVTLFTDKEESHISKIAVPEKTKVKADCSLKDNNLDCFIFEDGSKDIYDLATRCIYLEITPEEHEAQLKKLRIHVCNLYQSHIITKEIIKEKQLNLFKLKLWFCCYKDGVYERVSQISFSNTIRENRVAARKVKNNPVGNPANTSIT